MKDYPRVENYNSLSEALVAFVQWLRLQGLFIGIQESQEALRAAEMGCLQRKSSFFYALKTLFCTDPAERERFDVLFEHFWGREKMAVRGKTTLKNQSNIQKKSPASLVWMGMGNSSNGKKEEANQVSGANHVERLRKTDFSKLSEIESKELEEIAELLWKQMSLRLKRKMKVAPKGGKIDLRRTIRKSIATGGELLDLERKSPKPRKQRLVILLDVSGSMDTYSFFLLRFVCALKVHFERIEAFIFSTRLLRITEHLHSRNLEMTLKKLSMQADNWSSGTQIGLSLKTFNEEYSREILHGNSTVIVLSDGLETGDPEVLEEELKKIRLRTRRLIWLNPLKGTQGYEPIQKGMASALPQLDAFQSARNLDSMLKLEKLLLNV